MKSYITFIKKLILCVPLFLTLSLSAQRTSKGNTSPSSPVYGIVDMQKIILTVEEGKKARTQLETEIKQKEQELKQQKDELETLNREWQEKSSLLSEDAKMRKQQEFQEKILALRNAEISSQNEIKQKEAQATQKIAIKVAKIVDTLAKSKNLKVVFERNTSGLLYLENPMDLTDSVIVDYNKQNSNVASSSKVPSKK